MYRCPHCNATGISFIGKLWSGSASPATCRSCGCYSYLPTFWHVKATGLALGLLLLGAGSAWLMSKAILLLAGLVGYVTVHAIAWHIEPLQKTSPEQVKATRNYGNAILLVAVVAIAIAWWAQPSSP